MYRDNSLPKVLYRRLKGLNYLWQTLAKTYHRSNFCKSEKIKGEVTQNYVKASNASPLLRAMKNLEEQSWNSCSQNVETVFVMKPRRLIELTLYQPPPQALLMERMAAAGLANDA